MFDAKNMMCACDPRHGKYLTCSGKSAIIVVIEKTWKSLGLVIYRE